MSLWEGWFFFVIRHKIARLNQFNWKLNSSVITYIPNAENWYLFSESHYWLIQQTTVLIEG
jgi:hypothetical protein